MEDVELRNLIELEIVVQKYNLTVIIIFSKSSDDLFGLWIYLIDSDESNISCMNKMFDESNGSIFVNGNY